MILDSCGNPVSSRKFAHAASRDPRHGVQWLQKDKDINELIPAHDREALVVLSKRLCLNMGVPLAAVTQKAEACIGEAWLPTYEGSDVEAGEEAMSWLRNVFFPVADVRGGMHDWWDVLTTCCQGTDFEGGKFLLLTTSEDGTFPRVQHIPGHMVRSDRKDETVEAKLGRNAGKYRGLRLRDGVVLNKQGSDVAYRVEWNEDEAEFISARSMIHLKNELFQNQVRGLPVLSHGLNSLKSMLRSTDFEEIKQQIISSILLIEKNDDGSPELEGFDADAADLGGDTGVVSEQVEPHVRYFKGNSGNGLETISHDNPGPVWESFQDRLIRSTLAPIWPYSLVWKSEGQGTSERVAIDKARRLVKKRGKLMKYLAKRVCTYALAVGAEHGRVPALSQFLKLSFTRPPRLTVDDGREAKSEAEAYRAGHVNETEIQGAKGRTLEQHFAERAEEAAKKILARQAAEEKYGVEIDPREMGLLTPNDPPAAGATDSEGPPEGGTPDQEESNE